MIIGSILQARTRSTRFPRKVYEDLNGKYTMQRVLEGVKENKKLDFIILAMPEYDRKEVLDRLDKGELDKYIDNRFRLYFGSSDNLISRYLGAAEKYNIDLIVRVTCDCPFGGAVIDPMIDKYLKSGFNLNRDFLGNNNTVSSVPFPDGTDNELFGTPMLYRAMCAQTTDYEKEHCTPYLYRNNTQFGVRSYDNCKPNKTIDMRFADFSFDTSEDKNIILKICKEYDKLNDKLMMIDRLNVAIKNVK